MLPTAPYTSSASSTTPSPATKNHSWGAVTCRRSSSGSCLRRFARACSRNNLLMNTAYSPLLRQIVRFTSHVSALTGDDRLSPRDPRPSPVIRFPSLGCPGQTRPRVTATSVGRRGPAGRCAEGWTVVRPGRKPQTPTTARAGGRESEPVGAETRVRPGRRRSGRETRGGDGRRRRSGACRLNDGHASPPLGKVIGKRTIRA